MIIRKFSKSRGAYVLREFVKMDFGKFNRPWHRDFCYTDTMMQELIFSIIIGASIGVITIGEKTKKRTITNVMVDGAQRITTIRLFLENQFKVKLEGKMHYFKDLPKEVQRGFLMTPIYVDTLHECTEDDYIQYHCMVNFNGHRSKKHRSKILTLLSKMLDDLPPW